MIAAAGGVARARAGSQQHARELLAPLLLDPQRQRIGQKFLEQLRRALWWVQRVQAVFLDGRQVFLEALDAVHQPAAKQGRRFQQMVE